MGALCTCLSWRLLRRDRWSLWRLPFAEARCRVPPRRAGNFGVHITSLREMSEPPLREHLLTQMKVTKAKGLTQHPIRPPLCGSLSPDREAQSLAPPASSLRPRSTTPAVVQQSCHHAGSTSAQPRLDRFSWVMGGGRSLAASDAPSRRCARAKRKSNRMLSWGLCFGDFHLPQQMKVTRPPGRDPASSLCTRQASQKGQAR